MAILPLSWCLTVILPIGVEAPPQAKLNLGSQPVVKDGLLLTFQPTKAKFARKENLEFVVVYKNVSKKEFALSGSRFLSWQPTKLSFRFTNKKTKKVQVLRPGINPLIRAPVRLENKILKPENVLKIKASLNRWAWWIEPGKGRKMIGPEMLPAGEYEVSVHCEFGKGFGRGVKNFWVGKIASESITLEITN